MKNPAPPLWLNVWGRRASGLLLAICLFAVTGCLVISVHPFYQDEDLIFEPALLGRWQGEGQHWRFVPDDHDGKAYFITYSNDNKVAHMTGHLFQLENQWFLDLLGGTSAETLPPPIPSHTVLRIRLANGQLSLQGLDYDWLAEQLKKNPKLLRHQWRITPGDKPEDAFFILLAEPPELKEFLRKHLHVPEAWHHRILLERPNDR